MSSEPSSHKTRSHSLMGGSSASIYMNCTGYFSIIQDLPPQESSPEADKGTLFHELLEISFHDFLEHKMSGTDPDIRYHLISGNKHVDDEMLQHIEECKIAIWEKGLDKFITGKAYGFEDYFSLGSVGDIQIGGPVDFWAVYRDKKGQRVGLLVDYKYGYTYVDEKKTWQLPVYACSMYEEFERKLDYIRAVILQPRAGGETWREVKFTRTQLEQKKKQILEVGKSVFLDKKVKFKAGDHCTWCPGNKLGICEARKDYLQAQSRLKLVREDTALPKAETLTDEQLVKVLEYKDDIIDFLTGCYSFALLKAKKGEKIPGYKVVKGTAKRKWKDNITEIAEGLKKQGIKNPLKEPEPSLRTITDIEKELRKLKGDADTAKRSLEDFTQYGNVPEILVPETDSRPSITSYRDLLPENS